MAVAPEELQGPDDSPEDSGSWADNPTPSALDGPAPRMPDFARYIPNEVQEAIGRQDQADSWADEQRGKLAETWANIQHSRAADMVTGAIQAAKDALGTPGDLPDMNPLHLGTNLANAVTDAEGVPRQEMPSVPGVSGAAELAGNLSSFPGPGIASGSGMARQALEAQGVPAMMGAARETYDAANPLIRHVADQMGEDVAAKALDILNGKGLDRILRSPARYVDQPGREAETAAYFVHKAGSDADLLNALRGGEGAAGTGQTAEQLWDQVPGMGGRGGEGPPPTGGEPPDIFTAGQKPPPTGEPPPAMTPQAPKTFGDLYRLANQGIVQAKMMNPLAHGFNLGSEILGQYSNPRALGGIVGDFRNAETVMRDPEVLANVLKDAPNLNLPTMRQSANDLASVVSQALKDTPIVGGLANAYQKATEVNHRLLFETVGQRLQLASYFGARRLGMDPEAAASYANAKFGQISDADRTGLTKWIANNLAFAGRWTQGTGVQLGSLIGKPGVGGYGAALTAAQKGQLAGALRGDFLRGVGGLLAIHATFNHVLSGQWPWENEAGRWLDVNTGQKDDQGRTVYVTDPLFRRVQDALHLLAIPGSPMAEKMGTTTTATLANKLAPVPGAAAGLAFGAQYLEPSGQMPGIQPGPPIIGKGADLTDALAQGAAYAANLISPAHVSARMATRSDEGIKLEKPQLQVTGPGGVKYTTEKGLQGPPDAAQAAAGVGAALAASREAFGPKYLSQEQRSSDELGKAYGADMVKTFGDAGIKLALAPNKVTIKGVDLELTEPDREKFLAAKVSAMQAALDKNAKALAGATNPQQRKQMLQMVETSGYQAGVAAVAKGVGTEEIGRRQAVAKGAPTDDFFKKANSVTAPSGPPASSTAGDFFKKANAA